MAPTSQELELELLSRQINQAHRTAVQERLIAMGLTEIGHPMLLAILQSAIRSGNHPPAQRDLAELLYISPASVANSLKSLERYGYIHREPGQDARCNRIELTDKGRQAVEGCRTVFEEVTRQMLAGFTPEEQNQLLSFRRRMLHNLLETHTKYKPKEEC